MLSNTTRSISKASEQYQVQGKMIQVIASADGNTTSKPSIVILPELTGDQKPSTYYTDTSWEANQLKTGSSATRWSIETSDDALTIWKNDKSIYKFRST